MRRNKSIVISYMNLRTLIGILGMLLPVMCFAWSLIVNNKNVLESISMYYYTNFRDMVLGVLITFSAFLITYKGYDLLDNIITILIGVSGICIALFPCENIEVTEKVSFLLLNNSQTSIIHYSSAGLFFTLLAYNSLFLFTKSKEQVIGKSPKYYRNIIYRISGAVILTGLIGILIVLLFTSKRFINKSHIILILETIMLTAFGTSWFVKGGLILRDKKLTTAST